jgi:Mrp family chromosome partitioning ATPase
MIKTVVHEPQAASSAAEGGREPNPIALFGHQLEGELDPRLLLLRAPESPRAAAFRVLRHKIERAGRPRAILVSSPRQGEGKTLCAVNLALALAECNRARVLLMEGNLRSPQLAQLFNFSPPWCFAEQLVAHREQPLTPWKLVELLPQGLLVAAVDPRTEHRQLVDATAFAIAMERFAQERYDHIVVDGPPVLGSAEVNLLQDSTDCVLLTAMAGRSNARALRQAVEQLTPSVVLGVALVEGTSRG